MAQRNTNQLAVQMEAILDEFNVEVKRATNNAIDKVAKGSVQKLRNDSPKKTGDYARGWTTKRERNSDGINTVIVHNKTDYQLTHLLENPHEIVNKKGSYGKTSVGHGQKIHIKPVEEWANEELPKEIERELE